MMIDYFIKSPMVDGKSGFFLNIAYLDGWVCQNRFVDKFCCRQLTYNVNIDVHFMYDGNVTSFYSILLDIYKNHEIFLKAQTFSSETRAFGIRKWGFIKNQTIISISINDYICYVSLIPSIFIWDLRR